MKLMLLDGEENKTKQNTAECHSLLFFMTSQFSKLFNTLVYLIFTTLWEGVGEKAAHILPISEMQKLIFGESFWFTLHYRANEG